MYTLFLLLLSPQSADAALDRYAALKKATPSFQATVTCRINKGPASKGVLRVEPPKRLLYRAKWQQSDYALSITEHGTIETEAFGKYYDEHPDQVGLHIYESRISPTSRTFPFPLLVNDLRKTVRGKFASQGKQVVDGVSADVVYVESSNAEGQSSTRAWIDGSGNLIEVQSKYQPRGMPEVSYDWHFGPLKPLRNPSVALFQISPPNGYVPYAMDDPGIPVAVGQKLDLASVHAAGKKVLVAVVDDSAPSQRAAASLKSLQSGGLAVVKVGDSSPLSKQAHPPATPFFMLVGPDGKVENEWLGYDPAKAADFERQVREAAAKG